MRIVMCRGEYVPDGASLAEVVVSRDTQNLDYNSSTPLWIILPSRETVTRLTKPGRTILSRFILKTLKTAAFDFFDNLDYDVGQH
jgi:hypothetical protein